MLPGLDAEPELADGDHNAEAEGLPVGGKGTAGDGAHQTHLLVEGPAAAGEQDRRRQQSGQSGKKGLDPVPVFCHFFAIRFAWIGVSSPEGIDSRIIYDLK